MPIQDIIKFLRQSIMVQDPEVVVVDEDFLSMTEEDFIPLLQIALSKIDPSDDLFSLSNENLYGLILMSKKELYHRLANKTATKYSLTSATGVQLKRAEIFDHYYKLIEEVEQEYKTYISTGGGAVVKTGEILLSSRYFSQRNYNLASAPKISLSLDNIYEDKLELSWKLNKINKFAKYELYIGEKPILDKYNNNAISKEARKVETIKDIHRTCYRIEGLKADTEYYVLILAEERNGLQGFAELKFTTLAKEEEV